MYEVDDQIARMLREHYIREGQLNADWWLHEDRALRLMLEMRAMPPAGMPNNIATGKDADVIDDSRCTYDFRHQDESPGYGWQRAGRGWWKRLAMIDGTGVYWDPAERFEREQARYRQDFGDVKYPSGSE